MILSISRLKLFKACRRSYELRYVYDLIPVAKAEALEVGLAYHKKIEELYVNGGVIDFDDLSRENAMAVAYRKYIYPYFTVEGVEDWFEYPIGDDLFVGRVDGMTDDGILVEHKTTSAEIGEDYEYDLQWDEQILGYMLATGTRKMWYTVCRKPTIRQRMNESEEEFFWRMVEWYETDTQSKIKLIQIERTDEEIDAFRNELQTLIEEIKNCKNFYKNCGNCNRWGRRCEYSSVCLHYDPEQEYIEFKKREEVKRE